MRRLSLIVCFLVLSQASYAATGVREILDNYNYQVTVEWDQQDQAALEKFQEELSAGIDALIKDGVSPEAIVSEVVDEILDQGLKRDLREIFDQKKNRGLSNAELAQLITERSQAYTAQGASWSPVVKLLLGIAGGYVIFKVLLLTIYYWDYQPTDCTKMICDAPGKDPVP